jgi:hypothetical protein
LPHAAASTSRLISNPLKICTLQTPFLTTLSESHPYKLPGVGGGKHFPIVNFKKNRSERRPYSGDGKINLKSNRGKFQRKKESLSGKTGEKKKCLTYACMGIY